MVFKSIKDIKRIIEILGELNQPKQFNAKKFCGAPKTSESVLEIQKRLRDEW